MLKRLFARRLALNPNRCKSQLTLMASKRRLPAQSFEWIGHMTRLLSAFTGMALNVRVRKGTSTAL